MSKLLDQFNKLQLKTLPDITPGDTVKIYQKVKEGEKERIQVFEGVIIAKKHGKGIPATITVRKVTGGIGVERIFPIHSPAIDKIEVLRHAKVRRSKLYYLRTAKGKKAKLKKKDFAEIIADEEPKEEPAESVQEEPAEETKQIPPAGEEERTAEESPVKE